MNIDTITIFSLIAVAVLYLVLRLTRKNTCGCECDGCGSQHKSPVCSGTQAQIGDHRSVNRETASNRP